MTDDLAGDRPKSPRAIRLSLPSNGNNISGIGQRTWVCAVLRGDEASSPRPERSGTVKLDLSEIVRIPGSFAEHEIDITLKDVEGMTLTAPVRGKMYISSTGRVLLVEGAVDTEIEQVCERCGVLYRQPVHAEFQEDFVIRPAQAHGQGARIEEEEAPESRIFIKGTLDLHLDELLRQSILVALPLKPLCSDTCQGLCPRCGKRLSDGPCACEPETTTPQTAMLRRLLEKRQQQ